MKKQITLTVALRAAKLALENLSNHEAFQGDAPEFNNGGEGREALKLIRAATSELSEAEEIRRGELIAELLKLRKDEKTGRYNTRWGTKTALGLFRSVTRVIEDGVQLDT